MERCVHCHCSVVFGKFIVGQWSHTHGDTYCHDRNGFCSTPLRTAQPAFYPEDVVL